MEIENLVAKRVSSLPPYIFSRISKAIEEKQKDGVDVISFGVADPDMPTKEEVLSKLSLALKDRANHNYSETEGTPGFREAVSGFYKTRFGVQIDPTVEVINLIGAKEGIAHAAFAFLEKGDIALVCDPAYPVYSIASELAGAEVYRMPINPKNGYFPELNRLPESILERTKVIWLNYPNNPTGAVADLRMLKKVVDFALKNEILIMYDNCYSEITYDGYVAPSILQIAGAFECAIEFNSLSKSANMTGWRIGMACGNRSAIEALRKLKSNLDSGAPKALQEMGVVALEKQHTWIEKLRMVYQIRRDKVVSTLQKIGLKASLPKGGLCVWAEIGNEISSAKFAELVLSKTDVVVTPGNAFGHAGEGYIRLSLTLPDERIDEGLDRLAKFTL